MKNTILYITVHILDVLLDPDLLKKINFYRTLYSFLNLFLNLPKL